MKLKHRVMMDNVLLRIDTGDKVSAGGIIIETEGSRESMAREEGILEQVGSNAFSDYPEEERPKVGDVVVFARYGGKTLGKYEDGFERRVLQDTTILAVKVN